MAQSTGSCHDSHMKTWVAGVGSLVAGFCVFIAFGAIAVNVYDEKPRPWWLVSMLIIAIMLISAPIVGAVLTTLAEVLRQHRPRRLG
jgi:ABC-type Co2+ transport system permease subunit